MSVSAIIQMNTVRAANKTSGPFLVIPERAGYKPKRASLAM